MEKNLEERGRSADLSACVAPDNVERTGRRKTEEKIK